MSTDESSGDQPKPGRSQDAAQGLGAIHYKESLPVLKRIILESDNEALREMAYEAVLSILGKDDYDILKEGVDKPTVIDWELVRAL